jgi:beta-phosphoglucomutase family hydrolase
LPTPAGSGRSVRALGLPEWVSALIFDLDGVLTDTAAVHARAWKEVFDDFLAEHATGDAAAPFDIGTDYARSVDGRIRADGARTFLASRGVTLPEGEPSDAPTAATVYGVGNRKNEVLTTLIAHDGVNVYPGSFRYLEAVRAAGWATALVSASANARAVLEATGLAHFIDVRVDGVVAAARSLEGKPSPDTFLAAAELLDTEPSAAAVFEDAIAGVEAGRAGAFGWVVGVDRVGHSEALREAGADVVVEDLAELLTA